MKHGGRLRRAVLALGVGLTAAAASLPLAGAAEPGPAAPAPGVRAPGVADGRFSAGACPVPMPVNAGRTVRCGMVTVPARHGPASAPAAPDGATVEVAVAVVPARRPVGAPPLVMLAGGPGEKLVRPALAGLVAPLANDVPGGLAFLAQDRDLVLLEQRGAGLSRPALECPEVAAEWARSSPGATAALIEGVTAAYGSCADRLRAGGVDLTVFNTTEAARDVPAAVAALGYRDFDLFGTSYGARLALQVGRIEGSGLRRLVLASAIPAEADFVADVGASYDRALRELGAACAADAGCSALVPDLVGALDGVLRRLQAEPAPTLSVDAATGRVVVDAIDAFAFDSAVYGLFYSPGGPAAVPALVARAAAGDFSAFGGAAAGVQAVAVDATAVDATAVDAAAVAGTDPVLIGAQDSVAISLGQQITFLCAEEAARPEPIPDGTVRSLAAELFVASHPVLGTNLARVCAAWAVPPAPASVFEPVATTVPTLVAWGRFDQITPPSYGQRIAAALPAAVTVEVPAAGHSPLVGAGRCGLAVVVDFVARVDPSVPEQTCLAAPLAFRLDPAR